MEFTFDDYAAHIALLKDRGYAIVGYGEPEHGKQAILRHDVDFSLTAVAAFADIEAEKMDVRSTYFVLVRSDFYNCFSADNMERIRHIRACGHEIGLHFDETNYEIGNSRDKLCDAVMWEKGLLEQALGGQVKTVSMHRPSPFTLQGDFEFDGLINSYSQHYFHGWKYVSDSRMHWREDLKALIESGEHERLHILTHPFWYARRPETTGEKLLRFISDSKAERYDLMNANFRDLSEFVKKEEIT